MKRIPLVFSAALLASLLAMPALRAAEDQPLSEEAAKAESPLDFKVKDIDGEEVKLAQYKGKVLMVVNVASECGLTPQYEQLVALQEQYADKGFVVLGFPANDFRGQEPGTNEEIKLFCQENYNVNFPMFSKLSVLGEDKAPLFQYLTSEEKVGDFSGEIAWNFNKFLIGRDGQVIGRFEPRTRPDEPEVVAAIESALEQEVESEDTAA